VSLEALWTDASRLVAASRDGHDDRPPDGAPPAALIARGWVAFLGSLDDAQLATVEIEGAEARWPDGAPSSLLALVEQVRRVCGVAALPVSEANPVVARPARRLETPRKRAQIEAFARVIFPLAARAVRVVDVGSGHGHLTRAIAEQIALPVVGLERDGALAGRARALAEGAREALSPSFAVTDVLDDGLPVLEGDCVIGLHACGDLGDAMVESVARVRASVALVGCCLQKRRAPSRRALSRGGDAALDLPSSLLGLSNLTARDDGVEATRSENLLGRERRLALRRLLSVAGAPLRLGAEIAGLNRRAAQQELSSLVARAFALRGRAPPPREAIDEAARWAREQHARLRRLSLPRLLLARVLEVFVLLDRARYLEERGFEVSVGTLFPASVSARNLVLVARYDA
jgi:SAM-dependent methyltransferase